MRKFTVHPGQKISANRGITAAKDEELDPRYEEADELHDRVEDDFGYVLAGIERLGREGMIDEAINILNSLANTLDSAISIIGDNFEDRGE